MKLILHETFDCLERADVVSVYLQKENGERELIGSEKSRNELAVFKIIAAGQQKMREVVQNGDQEKTIM